MVSQLDETHPLNEGFNFGKADAIYTAVLVDLDHLDSKAWKGLPADGLARFQFLEVIVNCAMSSEAFSPVGTLRHWIKCLGLGQQVMKHRRMLHAAIFTEDFCHCMRRNQKMLQDVYNTYQKRFRLPTEPSLILAPGCPTAPSCNFWRIAKCPRWNGRTSGWPSLWARSFVWNNIGAFDTWS